MNFNEFLNEGSFKPMGLSIEDTKKVAETYAKAIAKIHGEKCTVNTRTLEEDSFDLDFAGEEFDGGSYSINSNGEVSNNAMGVGMKNPPVYGKWNDSVDTIIKNIKNLKLHENAMSDIDIIAQEAKDFKSFVKEFKKEYKNMDAGNPRELEAWLQSVYDSAKENMDESVVNETGFKKSDIKKTIDFINKEIGTAPGYALIGDEEDIKEFDKLWDLGKYEDAFDVLVVSTSMEISTLDDVKNVIKESKINEAEKFKSTKDFLDFCEEIDGMPENRIKRIMGKDYIDTPGGYADEAEDYDNDIEEYMISNMGRKEFEKLQDYWESNVAESKINEGKGFKNTKDFESFLEEIDGMPEAQIKKIMGKDYIDTPGGFSYEADDYDNDIEEYMISNMGRKEFEKLQDYWESNVAESLEITEGKNITVKRQYTENHPAIVVGKAAKIRNKVLEAIKDGKISQEEFDNLLKEMTTDSKRWLRRNAQCFNVSEDGISLSKTGSRILKNVMVSEAITNEGLNYKKLAKQFVNDEWLDVNDNIEDLDADEYFDDKLNAFNREELGNSKEFDNNKTNMSIEVKKLLKGRLKQIFEATTRAPKIWVPGGFDKAISKYPNNKITRKIVLDAAVKWEVAPEDAISYVEYGWMVDLDENKNTKDMKTKFIYESFAEFVENKLNEGTLNEAFASAKLASLLMGAYAMPKDLPQAFYNMSKLALDKIQDIDILEMTPEQAKKEKRESAVYLYFTTNEKENPYAGKSSYNAKSVPANTLLAITDGSNEWMNAEWSKYSKQATGRTLVKTKRDDSAGINKSSSNDQYGTGISSLKQVVDLADRAYCLDLAVLRARYSTTNLKAEREAARKGATAIMDPRAFKDENKARYNAILATKAAALPIDQVVLDAIDTLAEQIKDALTKGEKGKYGDILIGLDPRGKEVKLGDASNLMRNILDEYSRYVGDAAQSEKEVAAGYGGNYYDNSIKQRAKSITDYVKKIETKSYGW